MDEQSAQNQANSNDNGMDGGIQRTRSSITRTLLMNTGKSQQISKKLVLIISI